ncbi:hypothetical protein N9D95_02305 [Flavobacteriales bacterium]|nr:hypothetical protein [Flavobacteriales bacterium]
MNRILSLLVLLALTTMAQAQSPYLPYNPDENADGLIGVSDLQGLLSLYGSEFSSTILSDNGNIAVVEVGDMDYYRCRSTCASLPGAWSLVNENSVGLILNQMDGEAWFEPMYTENWLNEAFKISGSGNPNPSNAQDERQCFCFAKQRPRVEYSYCSGGAPSEEAFNQCISEKLAEGWYPLSGFPSMRDQQGYIGDNDNFNNMYSPQTHASFWRWEQ